ncbi:NAD(P)H-dependent flavin reductase [Marinomonas ushuaiensis DSM 15871]|uniref:NAD(P)H-dependent flavin reductase n=1 Tax=Marinomonas ushuaiensis DSM 15871 TaxID=1122207 RepID=X7E9B0_9GAMM|nr:nitroreductase family protein [Marinomonas ushuaiensis]ETX12522.1 NAD(P)H-dependent flavin reductase [Marinomonas ushuaiensis DSM 15871]
MPHPIVVDLENRHTAKHYDASKAISKEDLDVILEALRLSPSSIDSQPWKFIVIESDEAKQRFHNTFESKHQFNQKHAKAASHIILFAHKTHYSREDFNKVLDVHVQIGRIAEENREQAFGSFAFVDMNTDEQGDNAAWTKAQVYLALGNLMHVLARLKIDSTPLEGIDHELVAEEFANELVGYQCDVALAMGYSDAVNDFNASLPKSRLPKESIVTII